MRCPGCPHRGVSTSWLTDYSTITRIRTHRSYSATVYLTRISWLVELMPSKNLPSGVNAIRDTSTRGGLLIIVTRAAQGTDRMDTCFPVFGSRIFPPEPVVAYALHVNCALIPDQKKLLRVLAIQFQLISNVDSLRNPQNTLSLASFFTADLGATSRSHHYIC